MNGRSRPTGAAPETLAKESTASVPPDAAEAARNASYAAWAVATEAENIVLLEQLALSALAKLTTEQLRGLIWIGLLDDGWRRLLGELARRGEVW